MSAYARAKEPTCLEAGHQKLEPTGAVAETSWGECLERAPHEVEIRMERREARPVHNGQWQWQMGSRWWGEVTAPNANARRGGRR